MVQVPYPPHPYMGVGVGDERPNGQRWRSCGAKLLKSSVVLMYVRSTMMPLLCCLGLVWHFYVEIECQTSPHSGQPTVWLKWAGIACWRQCSGVQYIQSMWWWNAHVFMVGFWKPHLRHKRICKKNNAKLLKLGVLWYSRTPHIRTPNIWKPRYPDGFRREWIFYCIYILAYQEIRVSV